jgi:hypothetical protein
MGPPVRALLVRGVATVEIVDCVAPEYLAAAAKSTHGNELAAFEGQIRAVYKQMARITIAPNWARFYDFGSERFPSFLRRLVDSTSAWAGWKQIAVAGAANGAWVPSTTSGILRAAAYGPTAEEHPASGRSQFKLGAEVELDLLDPRHQATRSRLAPGASGSTRPN